MSKKTVKLLNRLSKDAWPTKEWLEHSWGDSGEASMITSLWSVLREHVDVDEAATDLADPDTTYNGGLIGLTDGTWYEYRRPGWSEWDEDAGDRHEFGEWVEIGRPDWVDWDENE